VKPLKAKLTALGERHIRQSGGKMAEKWRRTEDFYDYSELKDERRKQNRDQTGFLRCKVICGSEVAEKMNIESF
jgi:hypothetical protein